MKELFQEFRSLFLVSPELVQCFQSSTFFANNVMGVGRNPWILGINIFVFPKFAGEFKKSRYSFVAVFNGQVVSYFVGFLSYYMTMIFSLVGLILFALFLAEFGLGMVNRFAPN
jgi:hypothetical protein